MQVWVRTNFDLIDQALISLISKMGYGAHTEQTPHTQLALVYLQQRFPPYPLPLPVPTLVLADTQDQESISLLQRGYRGLISPHDSLERLEQALRAVARGEIWASRELLGRTFSSFVVTALTRREEEVLDLIAAGLGTSMIAAQLNISRHTVKAHTSSIFNKYGVRNRTELLAKSSLPR